MYSYEKIVICVLILMGNLLLFSQESPNSKPLKPNYSISPEADSIFLWYYTSENAFYNAPDLGSQLPNYCKTESDENIESVIPGPESTGDDMLLSGCSSSVPKIVNVIVHFILRSNGTGNFNETGDGLGGSYNGYQRAEDLITNANALWANNQQMYLPLGNSTPIENTRVRYVLKGTYFHRSDKHYNGTGLFDFSINNSYGVDRSTTMNIYLIPPSDGASGVACGIGDLNEPRCASGLSTKVYEDWQAYQQHGG